MKAGAVTHLKTKRLKKRLGRPMYQVIGILELLWQTAADCAWDGNIGRFTDEEIADALEWENDPTKLISDLVESGFVDRDGQNMFGEPCRLVVHDWQDHLPDYLKKRIAREQDRRRSNKDLGAVLSANGGQRQTTAENVRQRRPTKANQGKANQGKANQGKANQVASNGNGSVGSSANGKVQRRPGPLEGITAAELSDAEALVKRWRFVANMKLYGVQLTEHGRHEFFALALTAVEVTRRDGGCPIKLFVSNLTNGRRYISEESDQQARRLLKEHDRQSRGPLAPDVASAITAGADRMAVAPVPTEDDLP